MTEQILATAEPHQLSSYVQQDQPGIQPKNNGIPGEKGCTGL